MANYSITYNELTYWGAGFDQRSLLSNFAKNTNKKVAPQSYIQPAGNPGGLFLLCELTLSGDGKAFIATFSKCLMRR